MKVVKVDIFAQLIFLKIYFISIFILSPNIEVFLNGPSLVKFTVFGVD